MEKQQKTGKNRTILTSGMVAAVILSGVMVFVLTSALNNVGVSIERFGFYSFRQIQTTLLDATRLHDALDAAAIAPGEPAAIAHLAEANDLAFIRFRTEDHTKLFDDVPTYKPIFRRMELLIGAVDNLLARGSPLNAAGLTTVSRETDQLLKEMNELYYAHGNEVNADVEHANERLGQLSTAVRVILGLFFTLVLGAVVLLANRHESTLRLRHQAMHDSLTGMKNRAWLNRYHEKMFDTAHVSGCYLMLALIDLDHFKQVNDTHGHHVGDALLVHVAQQLMSLEKERQIAVVRLGGDELAMIAIVKDIEAATELQNTVYRALNKTVDIAGIQLRLGASVGIALYPDNGSDIDSLTHNADQALYAAKDAGRGRSLRYDPKTMSPQSDPSIMALRLRKAIKNDEFELYWQPIFDLHTGGLSGAEAILRWNDSETGEVKLPQEFIPFAEQTEIIYDLDRLVMARACAAAAAWEAEFDSGFVISVNISALHLQSGDLPDHLVALAAKSGVSPGQLELDIAEGTLVTDRDLAFETIRELRGNGFRVALDDFGGGTADVQYLSELDIDRLKLHGSFIANIDTSAKKRALISALISVCKSINVEVIAEGVETPSQLEVLLKEGCDLAQGFLLAQPADTKAFGTYLRRNANERNGSKKETSKSAA